MNINQIPATLNLVLPGEWETLAPTVPPSDDDASNKPIVDRVLQRLYTDEPTTLAAIWLERPDDASASTFINSIAEAASEDEVTELVSHSYGYSMARRMPRDPGADPLAVKYWLARPDSRFALVLAFTIGGAQARDELPYYEHCAQATTWSDLG